MESPSQSPLLGLALLAGIVLWLEHKRQTDKPRLRNMAAFTDSSGVIHPIRGTEGYDSEIERKATKTSGTKPEAKAEKSEARKLLPGQAETEITIKRPSGQTEVVTQQGRIPGQMRRAMTEATRKAGRGEIVGWEEFEEPLPVPTPAEIARGKVEGLFERARRSKEYDPNAYFVGQDKARAALQEWREQYPAEAATERAEQKKFEREEAERREREFKESFIGRGLD